MSSPSPSPIPHITELPVSVIPVSHQAPTASLGTIAEAASSVDLLALADLIDCGAPTSGQYAKSGFWDDDSDSDNDGGKDKASGRDSLSGDASEVSSTARSWRQRLSTTSVKGGRRSRAGTLPGPASPAVVSEGGWSWHLNKLSFSANPSAPPPLTSPPLVSPGIKHDGALVASPALELPTMPSPAVPAAASTGMVISSPSLPDSQPNTPARPSMSLSDAASSSHAPPPILQPAVEGPTLKSSKSRSRLRSLGMGNRSKLPPDALKKGDRKVDAEAELKSPTADPRSPLTPVEFNSMSTEQTRTGKPSFPGKTKVDKRSVREDPKQKSVWKRGVERLWRSKSTSGLRDSFPHQQHPFDSPAPPVPELPPMHILGAMSGTPKPPRDPNRDITKVISAPHARENNHPIMTDLDKRYPSFPVQASPGRSPLLTDEEVFDSDPFASVVDYAASPRPASRISCIDSRSPARDFSTLPSTQPELSRRASFKAGLMPRLRKSKSMMNSRPTSIVGFFDRKKTFHSPHLHPFDSDAPVKQRIAMNELVATSAIMTGDLEPPKPRFYDSFDIPRSEEDVTTSNDNRPTGIIKGLEHFDDSAPCSPSAASSQPPFLASVTPELILETATLSGHSAEYIATPIATSAPAHVTSYADLDRRAIYPDDRLCDQTNRNSGDSLYSFPLASIHHVHPHHRHHSHHHCSTSRSSASSHSHSHSHSLSSQRDSASFQDFYQQLGIWPEQAETSLGQLPDHPPSSPTAEPITDDPARDDQSACDPSPLTTPGANWEPRVRGFSTVDDFVLPPSSIPTEDASTPSYHSAQEFPDILDDILNMDAFKNISANVRDSFRSGSGRDASRSTSHNPPNCESEYRTAMTGKEAWHDASLENNSSSSDSNRERRRRAAPAEGGWSMDSDTSDGENDDVPLSKLHPAAGAAQQQRLADAARRREARRAERERKLRHSKSQLLDRERERSIAIREREQRDLHRGVSMREPRRSRNALPEWNGEGGVPADMLAGRLERVAVSSPTKSSSQPQQRSVSAGVSRAPTRKLPSGGVPPLPNLSRPNRDDSFPGTPTTPSASMSRTPTAGATSSQNPSHSREQHPYDLSRGAPSSLSTSRIANSADATGTSVSRSNTASRRRALSNARELPSSTEAPPPVPRRGVPVRCSVVFSGKESSLPVEIFPETTTRDVLSKARETFQLVDGTNGPTSGWVVCEMFAELGLERQLREYEVISNVMRGWDAQGSSRNCLLIRESHHANQTLAKSIGDSAPFVGGWVQLETKPGKWNKRWLETRGGHVFLSKNEKGKDEIQINTLFSDTYTPCKGYPGPQRYVFALKRLEPLASFENPTEHIHFISTDDATGWKLSTASYTARSFTLVSTQKTAQVSHSGPSLNPTPSLVRGPSHGHSSGTAPSHSHHTEHNGHTRGARHVSGGPQPPSEPLIDLKVGTGPSRQPTTRRNLGLTSNDGFTGKGLLGRI